LIYPPQSALGKLYMTGLRDGPNEGIGVARGLNYSSVNASCESRARWAEASANFARRQ
jgi:hypothetical protein